MKLKFVKMGINGEGIAYDRRQPVFCQNVLPQETALVSIREKHSSYCSAVLQKIITPSKHRTVSPCPYQSECGGCPLLIMEKTAQSFYKKQLLEEALLKYGRVKSHFVRDLRQSPSHLHTRNQCKLHVQKIDGVLCTGMFKRGTNHFIAIDECLMHDPLIEACRKEILAILNEDGWDCYDEKTRRGLRYIVLRCIDERVQCTLITGKNSVSADVVDRIMKIDHLDGLFQSVNTNRRSADFFGSRPVALGGNSTMPLAIGPISLQLSPASFFQLNTAQARIMYETAIAKVDRCDLLVEAYCGIGAMSLLAAKKAKQVIGIEIVPDAIANAKANAAANNITNAEFLCMDAAEGLYKAAMKQTPDILLVDPPRSGMDDDMLEAIAKVHPRKIIYISCNPATLGKNLKELKHYYHVVTVMPFDLFPNTAHVESITVLEADNYS